MPTIDPKTTALLLQDLQNDVVKGDLKLVPTSNQQLVANCQKLLNQARQVGMPVIFVQAVWRPDRKDAPKPPPNIDPAKAGPGRLPTQGTEGGKIISELEPRPEEVVVSKHTTSPFNNTDIEVYLRRFGVSTLILTGVSTTGVVEASLRDARDNDYSCIVAKDCCGAGTLEEHNACVNIVFPRMAWVTDSDEIIKSIKG